MKQISKIVLAIVILCTTIYACSNENEIDFETKSVENLDVLSPKITLKSSTNETSKLFRNLGTSKINVKVRGNQTFVNLISIRTFNFRGQAINLSDYSVKFNERIIILNEDDRYKIALKNDKAFLITPEYKGFYEDADLKTLQNIKTFILVSFLNELTYTDNKVELASIEKGMVIIDEGCSFWDQGFSVGVGITSQSAQADLEASMADDISSGQTAGCTKIGTPEAVPWTNGTVWTQAWCCA